MLDVGFSEILLTSAIALIVLGPERLPKVARQVGNWMGRARAMARQLSEQLEREVSAEEFLKTQSKPSSSVDLPSSGTHLPNNGAAFDRSNPPSIEPPSPPMRDTSVAAMHASDAPVTDTQSIAPPPAIDPAHGGASAPTEAAPMHAGEPEPTHGLGTAATAAGEAAPAHANAAEPTYGMAGAATSAAAMHAADPHAADSKPPP